MVLSKWKTLTTFASVFLNPQVVICGYIWTVCYKGHLGLNLVTVKMQLVLQIPRNLPASKPGERRVYICLCLWVLALRITHTHMVMKGYNQSGYHTSKHLNLPAEEAFYESWAHKHKKLFMFRSEHGVKVSLVSFRNLPLLVDAITTPVWRGRNTMKCIHWWQFESSHAHYSDEIQIVYNTSIANIQLMNSYNSNICSNKLQTTH